MQAGVGHQLFSNISVWTERVNCKGVNNMVILVDPDGVLWGRDQEVLVHSVNEC